MTIKKIYLLGGGQGIWGNHPNFFFEVLLQYLLLYLSMLHGYPSNIHTFMPSIGSWSVIINFSIILNKNRSPEKWRFSALKSLLLPQFSTYRHRTSFILKRKQVHIANYPRLPIKIFFFKYLKLFILPPKTMSFSKNSINFFFFFFSKTYYW